MPKEEKTIADKLVEHEAVQITNDCFWTEVIYNAGEPTNLVHYSGFRNGNFCSANLIKCLATFNDGSLYCFITPCDDDRFEWWIDGKTGICDSLNEAWQKMPALITNPDYHERIESN